MGFGARSNYTNAAQVPYPTQTLITATGSLRPPTSTTLFDDLFNSPVQGGGAQTAWSQYIAGGNAFIGGGYQQDLTKLCSFLRVSPIAAMEGSSGSLQVYAGTVAGTGNNLTGAGPTCDARRYVDFQGQHVLGCEVWYSFLPQMNNEEGLFAVALSQMDGNIERRVNLRMDHLLGRVRVDYETSVLAADPTSESQPLSWASLSVPDAADGAVYGKWNRVLLEGDFTANVITRAIVNQVDYSNVLASKSLATQMNAEAAKTGVAITLYNQNGPIRGAEFFVGRASLYKVS
jgi:hypothetical protein